MNNLLMYNVFLKRVDAKLPSIALLTKAINDEIDELVEEIKNQKWFKLTTNSDVLSIDYFRLSANRKDMPHNSDAVYQSIKHQYDKIMFEMADLTGLLFVAKRRGYGKDTSLLNFLDAKANNKVPRSIDAVITRGYQLLRLIYCELHQDKLITFRDFLEYLLQLIVVKANFRYSASEHLVNVPRDRTNE